MANQSNVTKCESDVEVSNSMADSDKNNNTTDDEFYGELMDVPAEFQDCLVPEKCLDEVQGIEHLMQCLDRRFQAYPVVFTGKLQEALNEAINPKKINERCPLLIYVNNDKGIYTNLFCKQLLCNYRVIEYLMSNYVFWAWDVTFPSNGSKLNENFRAAFASWKKEKQIDLHNADQYPLLIGVFRDTDGNYCFDRLVEGPSKKLVLDEFISMLVEFKGKFHSCEEKLEQNRERRKQEMLANIYQRRDLHDPSNRLNRREFLRATSMFPRMDYDWDAAQLAELSEEQFTADPAKKARLQRFLSHHHRALNEGGTSSLFERVYMDADDGDDEDDDDDNGLTPTGEHPPPVFPSTKK